jgi:hypothetical protein
MFPVETQFHTSDRPTAPQKTLGVFSFNNYSILFTIKELLLLLLLLLIYSTTTTTTKKAEKSCLSAGSGSVRVMVALEVWILGGIVTLFGLFNIILTRGMIEAQKEGFQDLNIALMEFAEKLLSGGFADIEPPNPLQAVFAQILMKNLRDNAGQFTGETIELEP